MTIKEMEARTGLARANIRFYEAEGLIAPERKANGYRDYSEDDLAILQRIKLLRTLHMSLEEIKAVHAGDHTLAQALERHLEQLELDQADLQRSKVVCQVMQGDGVSYDTLDAQRYLEELERAAQGPPAELRDDQIPRVKSPWRRFFARMLDESFYALVWMAILGLVFNVNFMERTLLGMGLDFIMILVLNLLLEPLFLSRLGWTPGKWLLGLRVTDFDDRNLSFEEAMTRTKKVLYKGVGLNVPIFNLICIWASHDECLRGNTLYWEENSLLVQKDTKKVRVLLYVPAVLLAYGLQMVLYEAALLPKNRGDLTVAEFAENYNDYVTFFDIDTNRAMTENGGWTEKQNAYDWVTIAFQDGDTVPHYDFTMDGNSITGMSFQISNEGRRAAESYQDDMRMAIMAFVRPQRACGFFNQDLKEVLSFIEENPYTDYRFTVGGVDISCDIEHSGYLNDGSEGILFAQENPDTTFSIVFSMEKTGS